MPSSTVGLWYLWPQATPPASALAPTSEPLSAPVLIDEETTRTDARAKEEEAPLLQRSPDEPALPARQGLTIAPRYHVDGHFEGYLVQGRSGDHRYAHGDVITKISGVPVEDSAAGSELVLIALAQPEATIEVLERTIPQ